MEAQILGKLNTTYRKPIIQRAFTYSSHNNTISFGSNGIKRVLTCFNEEIPHVDDTLRSLLGGDFARKSVSELEKFIETTYGTKKLNLEGDLFLARHAINAFEMAKNRGFSVAGLGIWKTPYRSLAFHHSYSDIVVPPDYNWKETAKIIKRRCHEEGNKFLSSGLSPEALLLHECSHFWHFQKDPEMYKFLSTVFLSENDIKHYKKLFTKKNILMKNDGSESYINYIHSINKNKLLHQRAHEYCGLIDKNRGLISREICTYPLNMPHKDKPGEFIAETLATAITHNTRISDYSERIQKIYKELGGPVTYQIL